MINNLSRKYRWILLLLLVVSATFLSLGFPSEEFRINLKEKSNAELMDRGRDYYRKSQLDSALLVFSYIGDSYRPDQPKEEKRLALLAKNNVGIIYAFDYMDYKKGYETLTETFELAESEGMEESQAVMCINIAELLRLYGICLQTENVNDRIDEYVRMGLKKAMVSKKYKVLASLVINTLEYDLSTPLEPLKIINDPQIPDSIEGVEYARAVLKGAECYQRGDIPGARAIIEKSYESIPYFGHTAIGEFGYLMTLAKTYAKEKNYSKAESIANDVLVKSDSVGALQNNLISLAFLAGIPVEKKDEYGRQLIMKKDAALSKGQLQMVSEIDFLRSLNRERDENLRLSKQRTRLFWGIGIAAFLLIVFGCLTGLLIYNRRKLQERNEFLYNKIQEGLSAPPVPEETSDISNDETEVDNSDNSKYAGSSLSNEKMDDLEKRLVELLNNEGIVCNSELSLARIAAELNVNTTYMSRVVNERFGKSFSALLSEYRVKIAIYRMMPDSEYANQTIESIARSVGYSSRSAFITAFKKINGMTPSEYLKLSREMAPSQNHSSDR